jgi:hypothetical protein
MMKTVIAKHLPYDDGHLGKVCADMMVAGQPTIHAVEFDGVFYATNGSHRLAAAKHLNLVPKIVVEPADCRGIPLDHWRRVAASLPRYDFDCVLVLRLD